MHLLITFVCAVVGAWFLVGGLASFIAPSAAAPSMGSSAVLGGVLLAIAFMMWRGRKHMAAVAKHMAAVAAGRRNWAVRNADVVERLPDIEGFRRAAQSLAALDALLTADWQHRFYSFDASWSGEHQLASMRNGCGDQWFARIGADGIVVHGLLHESPDFVAGKPKPWVFGELPRELGASFLTEPAFDTSNSTFCLWRAAADTRWSRGPVPAAARDDGSHELLEMLWAGAAGYLADASDGSEEQLQLADIEAFFRHEPVTLERARRMNPDVDFAALQEELAKIGYPSGRA
ncbi:MAG: hypothetical protein ACK501_10645 [Planctomycetota bacterium]